MTPSQPTLAAKAALHLLSRLVEPRAASLFDHVQFTDEQAACLLALAQAYIATQETRQRVASSGGKGRKQKTTAERRSEVARNAALAKHAKRALKEK